MGTMTFAGARAIFRVEGQKVAYASGVSGTEEIMYEPIDCLDNVETQEHVPTGYRVNFTTEIFRTIKGTAGAKVPREGVWGSVKQMGFFPKVGLNAQNALTSGVLSATVEDRLTNKVVQQMEECKCQSNSWSITPRGVVGYNLSWVAIRFKDESETA